MKELPSKINGYPVMAAVRTPSGKGEHVDQGVVIVVDHDGEFNAGTKNQFIVWYIASNPNVECGAWQAMNGRYGLTWSRALEVFGERMKSNEDVPWDRVFSPHKP
ncbi:hypothetical protein ACIOHC_36265 [Streptomyces sp. NPDC088252]|uniref:hypothetical protein n=1 Tax=Streptomyces sp. NPDC088252 TaxID=3365845 RepID=UPI003814D1D6